MSDKTAGLGALDSVTTEIQSGNDEVNDLESQITALTQTIRSDPNASQDDMIKLQGLIRKHNDAVELLSSLVKKRSDAMSSIVAKMR